MLYALSRPTIKQKVTAIEVAHIAPKNEALTNLQRQIDSLKAKHSYLPEVTTSSLDSILAAGEDWLGSYKAIFIVSELNRHPKQEDELIKFWQRYGEVRPKLICLRTDRNYDGEIMPHAELKEEPGAVVILPDLIEEDYKVKLNHQNELLQKGKKACALCAKLREESKGKHRPRGDFLHLDYTDYITKHPIKSIHTRIGRDCNGDHSPPSSAFEQRGL